MAVRGCLPFGFLVLVASFAGEAGCSASLNRTSLPVGFIFGTASSPYQYEGAAKAGGKGASIWDTITHKHPEKIKDHSNGDIAVDQYHRYKEDVKIMKEMGMQAYRFSISWTPILPKSVHSALLRGIGAPIGGVMQFVLVAD